MVRIFTTLTPDIEALNESSRTACSARPKLEFFR